MTTQSKFKPFESSGFLVKLAETENELEQAYRLRYLDLILEYNENPKSSSGIDTDIYDTYCDHLIVIDMKTNEVVGNYRLIRKEHLYHLKKYITESEFNIDNIKSDDYDILELGRAVVKKDFRQANVISLLWKGIITYAVSFNIKFMFGTASFHGIDPNLHKKEFSYLYHYKRPEERLKTYARSNASTNMNLLSIEEVDEVTVYKELPPLVKGYLRLGAVVSEDAYIDYSFNAIDVLILLEIEKVSPRYLNKYLGEKSNK